MTDLSAVFSEVFVNDFNSLSTMKESSEAGYGT
ncbi:hypothetical protein DSM25559_3775 [Agrobacterium rosae]|uniref:Uncharacterized protein n=1 Tax=Agrobacterium rosae TaxID=1972867 RepID=A0A1R3U3Z2_9HYPH|nr:hypothetical protein DSM25559_3775 [Agrobacterium rosae]